MTRSGVIVQARLGSTRLPGKVLLPLSNVPVLRHVLDRCAAADVGPVVVATTDNPNDGAIRTACAAWGYPCFSGSESDVLDRYFRCAEHFTLDPIVRVTSDCPLTDPDTIASILRSLDGSDYASNVFLRDFPRGLDVEAFTFTALARAQREASEPSDREHVTSFLRDPEAGFRNVAVPTPFDLRAPELRLTLDTAEDYAVLRAIYEHFYRPGHPVNVREVIPWLRKHPEVAARNAAVQQKRDARH